MKKPIPEMPPDFDASRLVERPDGFYWRDPESGELVGPFPTLLDAVNDMNYDPEAGPEPGETLEEAESEIGMSDWVDPETGEPAEEQVPRIEDH
jgi:hypothetical protein